MDGNKQTALTLTELFLLLNGQELMADDASYVTPLLLLAAGDLPEAARLCRFSASFVVYIQLDSDHNHTRIPSYNGGFFHGLMPYPTIFLALSSTCAMPTVAI